MCYYWKTYRLFQINSINLVEKHPIASFKMNAKSDIFKIKSFGGELYVSGVYPNKHKRNCKSMKQKF